MPHCWKTRVAAHILMCLCLAGVNARNQEFFIRGGGGGGGGGGGVGGWGGGGGWGGPGPTAGKQSGQRFFFLYSPELILQLTEGVQCFYYSENYTFLRIQRGSRIFQGEGV